MVCWLLMPFIGNGLAGGGAGEKYVELRALPWDLLTESVSEMDDVSLRASHAELPPAPRRSRASRSKRMRVSSFSSYTL